MDLVASCRAFVAVSRHGSFTVGAQAAGIPQSVASRRIAALERHLGGRLLDRAARTVTLTPFGADLLPAARSLVTLAETLEHDAARARRRPYRLSMPPSCTPTALARLVAAARTHDLHLSISSTPSPSSAPSSTAASSSMTASSTLTSHSADAAVVAIAPDQATWHIPLGLAGRSPTAPPVLHVESLRVRRSDTPRRSIWIQPDDGVPHIYDKLTKLAAAVGLRPAQITLALTQVEAAAEALSTDDLLLCSRPQSDTLGLHWRPIGELTLTRAYDLTSDVHNLRTLLHTELADALGGGR
jgi:DNA-binding transcriptional LysR family regulator